MSSETDRQRAVLPVDERPQSAAASDQASRAVGRFTILVPTSLLRLGMAMGLVGLFLITAAAQIVDGLPEADWAFGIIAITSLDYRGNIANWSLAALVMACAIQLAMLGRLRRRAMPFAARLCWALACLALLASLVGFTDFAERLYLWLPTAEILDDWLFWAALLGIPAVMPYLLGDGYRSRPWPAVLAIAAAVVALHVLVGGDKTKSYAVALWLSVGGGESGVERVADLMTLVQMMLRLVLAGTIALVLLDKLAKAAAVVGFDRR